VDELRSIFRHVVSTFYRRVTKTKWSPFILSDLIKEGIRHISNFVEARAKTAKDFNQSESSPKKDVKLSVLSGIGSYIHVAG
jgi:hypothetical protein